MKVSDAMAKRLLHKHLTGDFGSGTWLTIVALLKAGLVVEQGKSLVVTETGRQWCDENHMKVGTA